MSAILIKTGDKFGKLTILNEEQPRVRSSGLKTRIDRKFNCLCDCGNSKIIYLSSLRNGDTKSCGCNQVEAARKMGLLSKTHGLSKTPLYRVYNDLKSRCTNSNHAEYHNYGGRGITVCDQWMSNFMAFHTWAINSGYKAGLEIDRENNDKGYSPDNCRWVTRITNCYNQRKTFMIQWDGQEMPLGELCLKLNLNKLRIYQRIARDGMSLIDAIGRPLKKHSNNRAL